MKSHALMPLTPGFYRDVERPILHVIVPEVAARLEALGNRRETARYVAETMLDALDLARDPGFERYVLVAHFKREPWLSRVRKG